jgi:CheY-like chemotaxis protein
MSKIILCADDSATIQKVAEITFRGTDYTYVGARSVDEALDKARGQKPALVLADAVMSGKGGYDLCQALKADGALGDIPVVILCGNSAPYDAARGTAVGADATVTKPWDTQVMLDKVSEVLEKAASHGVAKAAGGAAAAAAAPAKTVVGQAAPPMPPAMTPQPMSPALAAAAAAKAAAQMPPRSATIMGMPTIKMPPGPGMTAQPVPLSGAAPAPIPVPATFTPKPPTMPPPVAAAPAPAPKPIPAPAPAPAPAPRAANPTPAPYAAHAAAAAPAASLGRPPMVAGVPTKRSALVERTLAKMAARLAEASGLEPGSPELLALLKLSTEVVERIVWEVVPELAETIIRENLVELAAKRAN